MNTKNNIVATTLQQIKATKEQQLPKSPVELYNDRVELYKRTHTVTPAEAHTIITYLNAWKTLKLTPEAFNKEVVKFNNKYGLLIPKKEEKQVFNNLSKEYNYINLAIINAKSIEKTMDNFQHYKTDYNLLCKTLNKKVAKYNKEVVIPESKLTAEEKIKVAQFKRLHNAEFTKVYNACVDFENQDRAIHKKRKYQTIKDQAEVIFRICVQFYASQLTKFNKQRQKLGQPTRFSKKDQPMFVLNHKSIADYQLNGIKRINACKRTVKNQIKRLKEAGVFTTWIFSGYQRPIYCHFNPKIFILKEGKTPKTLNTKNQLVTIEKVQKLHVYKQYNTTNNINKEKKKDYRKNDTLKNTGSMQESLKQYVAALAYKNTSENKMQKNKLGTEILKPPVHTINKVLSKNYRLKILNDVFLAKQMAANFYVNNYKLIEYKNIKRVLLETDLDYKEITDLLLQDFLKSTWKIYKDRNVYVGAWINAMRLMRKEMFGNKIYHCLKNENWTKNKKVDYILNLVKKYREMLELARRILIKHNRSAYYPLNYFNIRKTEPKQYAFFGLEKIYFQKLRQDQEKEQIQKKNNQKILRERKKIRQDILLEKALIRFAKGTYTFQNLCDYVLKHHPNRFDEIANMINLNALNKC